MTTIMPRPPSSPHYQLTPLWERILRTNRLPSEVDLDQVFQALRDRLQDPEREVRQHALRVLADLIPAVVTSLDDRMSFLLDDVLANLGHSAPAVRKGSLDALKVYLSHSAIRETVLKNICSKCLEINNTKKQEDITAGILIALPSLFLSSLTFNHDLSDLISLVIRTLSSKILHVSFQESAMRSLIKMKEIIGEEDFDRHYNEIKGPHTSENFKTLCDAYSGAYLSESKKNTPEDFKNHEIAKPNLRSPSKSEKRVVKIDKNLENVEKTDNNEHVPNGKIILETEFTFDSDTAITMTIMEEDEETLNRAAESEEEYSSGGKSVIKILTESEANEYDASRRTPRRVRFGGEVVKMRTPDSDNIINSDQDDTITESSPLNSKSNSGDEEKIDDYDIANGKIKRVKSTSSLIPVPKEPITTLPKYNNKTPSLENGKKNKSKSLNDLSAYCKTHFGLPQEAKSSSEDEQNNKIYDRKHVLMSPKKNIHVISDDILGADDSQSGNSSNGSGCSDDKVLEDFSDLSTLDNVILQDLFRMEGQRGAIQALEKLAQRLQDDPELGARLTGTQAGAAAVRLAAAARRVRGRPSEAASSCLRALVRSINTRALKSALPAFSTAISGAGNKATPLVTEIVRKIPPGDLIEALLNEQNPHWKSCKLVAGALRGVAIGIRAAPGASIRIRAAVSKCVECASWPRRRVRAAALDALAALASLSSPRAVLAEVHKQTEMSRDGDQLYDAVLARLCRPVVSIGSAGGRGGVRRADVSWINSGRGDLSPTSPKKLNKKSDVWKKSPSSALGEPSLMRLPTNSSTLRTKLDFNDINMAGEGRVGTAPVAGLALRPLSLPSPGTAPQRVAWTQPVQTWPAQGIWTPNSNPTGNWNQQGSWNNSQAQVGAWPNHPVPTILRTLSPPQQPQHSKWTSRQDGDDSTLVLMTTRDSGEGTISTIQQHHHHQKYNESKDEIIQRSPSNKSEPNVNRWSAASNNRSQSPIHEVTASSSIGAPSPSVTVRSSTATISDHHITPKHVDTNSNSSNGVTQAPPNIEDEDLYDDHQPTVSTERSPSIGSRSLREKRFCDEDDDQQEEDLQETLDYEDKYHQFGVLEDIEEVDGETGSRVSLKSKASAKSFVIPPSPKMEVTRNNQPVSAPPIAYMGSSVSTEEDIKSVESDSSYRESVKSYSSDGNDMLNDEAIIGSKISPESKKSSKLIKPSKIAKNKIQPLTKETPGSPFDKPKEALSKSLTQLEHSDWAVIMNGLTMMEKLFRHHPVFMEPHLTSSARAVATQVKNLRSQVARAACKLAGDMFVSQKKYIEGDADELVVPLLNRTADTNKFLRADANMALDKMCESISAQKAISILMVRGTVHQNAVVRCTTTRLLANIVKNNGSEKIFSMPKKERDKFLQTAADLLTEGSLETRGHAKVLFKELSQNYLFLRTIREVIPLSKYRNIEKAINQIRIH